MVEAARDEWYWEARVVIEQLERLMVELGVPVLGGFH